MADTRLGLPAVLTAIAATAISLACAGTLSKPGAGLTPELSDRWGCDYGWVTSQAEMYRQHLSDPKDYYVPTVGWDVCELLAHNGAPSRVEERVDSVSWWYENATVKFNVMLHREQRRYSDTPVWVVGRVATPEERNVAPVTRVFGPGGRAQEIHPTESAASAHYVDATVDRVWEALSAVYRELGIPADLADSWNMTVGNRGFRPERIDGSRLSRFVDCGSGASGAPNADRYYVTMNVVTRLSEQAAQRVLLETQVGATADPRDTGGSTVRCRSTGRLEQRIAELVTAALAPSGASLERLPLDFRNDKPLNIEIISF